MFRALVIDDQIERVFRGDPPAEVADKLKEPGARLEESTAEAFLEDYARRNNGLPDIDNE